MAVKVPVASFPRLLETLEGLVQRDLFGDVTWPRYLALNILAPRFRAPVWRGELHVGVLEVTLDPL
eukprot:8441526-Pyramimonas_sp.AAC.1